MRWIVDPRDVGLIAIDGDHAAWTHSAETAGELWATGLGDDPARVVALVERLDEARPLDGITVPDHVFRALPKHLRSPKHGYWSCWFLDYDADLDRANRAVELPPDDPRIAPLLQHSTSAYVLPGDPRVARWTGVVEDGRLVSVAGQLTEHDGVAHIVSVCTHPDRRGRGLARDVCNAIITSARDEGAPMVYLEMYARNEAGRRTYSALGFVESGTYRSGLLPPRRPETSL